MRVLVCGGRDYYDTGSLYAVLDALHAGSPFKLLIHGGANGADSLAGQWAKDRGVMAMMFPADWEHDGKAAGPIRNSRMLAVGMPDLVVAFAGGRGTEDMMTKARAAGVKVLETNEKFQAALEGRLPLKEGFHSAVREGDFKPNPCCGSDKAQFHFGTGDMICGKCGVTLRRGGERPLEAR